VTTWIVLRAAGIGAYVALFLAVAWGLIGTTSLVTKRVSKPAANSFHGTVAAAGLALLGIHLGGLLVDSFVPFHLLDLVIPMRTAYRPVAVAAGILALYGLVLVLASSWMRKRIGTAWWRRVHALAIPVFAMSMLHGIFAGSDTDRPWMLWLYAATGLVTLFLIVARAIMLANPPARRARSPASPA
jgi:methionine sulfoxide reductase heme-binding subunit